MIDEPELAAAIDAMFQLAASNELGKRIGEIALEHRTRATLALALFMPHPEARRCLFALMSSDAFPEQVRSVAADAIHDWNTETLSQP